MTTWLDCRGLNKRLGGKPVLRGLDLAVARGRVLSILGPSGSGKTTLMRLIAGLSDPDAGEIAIAGQTVWNGAIRTKPEQRRVGLVFQDYALWPHMTVAGNVAFGLRLAGMTRADREARVRETLAAVHILDLADRFPDALSGGQQQRAALARSLAGRPELLLLDEPLSNLDAALRESLRLEILDVIRTHEMTAVYITHDQTEAMALADELAVINGGRILQTGAPEALYRQPNCSFVASFLGGANLLPGRVAATPSGIDFVAGDLSLRTVDPDLPEAAPVAMLIRPEDAAPADRFPPNALDGRVTSCLFLGRCWRLGVAVAGQELRIDWDRRVPVGEMLGFSIAPERCTLVRADGA